MVQATARAVLLKEAYMHHDTGEEKLIMVTVRVGRKKQRLTIRDRDR